MQMTIDVVFVIFSLSVICAFQTKKKTTERRTRKERKKFADLFLVMNVQEARKVHLRDGSA